MTADKESRWSEFSDEELAKLLYALIEEESEDPRPGSDPLRARLRDELDETLGER
jgi:hypothetical protein